ncbi:hypothetical protein LTR35_000965 [Friedmanniomyces endolithicus]|uniref:SigF-like NTF2-like domain-containing protein n=1 Tax=Friedmanniomyces endolithicus TaxID=329885 RepID=A0AAN6JAL8_9PEZI|nr:hypothetical protein LTR35_000965 [Friedmanniomyces endolithicus]KAK0323446.1 hypothetical protein LTR82_005806 [Friedmanniomyces endolithicus]KAK1013417.1 hypothetical protein LTR54_004324 [Friedmanniomyces endolithicus]
MDDPVREITDIVLRLTQGSPKTQAQTINQYFTPNASFTHPFCRTGSFEGSRWLIHAIFRWYKIMSPRVKAQVNGIGTGPPIFAIWFVPFHRSPVTLTTKLQLTRKPTSTRLATNKLYIQSQEDLYQVDQFVRFFAPWGVGDAVVYLWHFIATIGCVVLSIIFAPFTRLEERYAEGRVGRVEEVFMKSVEGIEERRLTDGAERRAAEGLQEVAEGVRRRLERDEAEKRELEGMERAGVSSAGSLWSDGSRVGSRDSDALQQFGNMQVVT